MLHESAELSAITITNFFFGVPALLAIFLYGLAVYRSNRFKSLRKWPLRRSLFWISGVLIASSAVIGPLASVSHYNFTYHMVGHLLLGMLGPLLMALGAPVTLMLRTLKVDSARKVSRFLKNRFISYYTHPIVATTLNIGGLWVLYTTSLFDKMHENLMLYILIHIHMFVAGYLFTISLVPFDPISRRYSYLLRTIVFIFALAGHGILSKYIYAYPPEGINIEQARNGAMLMYYGGDAIDLVLIILLFYRWYRSACAANYSDNTLQMNIK